MSSYWPGRLVVVAFGAALVLAVPAAAEAATTFGSRLNQNPANSGECAMLATPCTIAAHIHPADPNGDPYSGGAPQDGVIVRFRIRAHGGAAPASVTFRLANVTFPDPQNLDVALGTAAGTGPIVTVPADTGGDTPISEFAARLPVKRGNQLAIDGTTVQATYSSGDEFSYRFDPPLVDGQGPRGSNGRTGELLVAAVVEPDSDGDGFGDETQDGCPTQASAQGPCPPGQEDRTSPALTGLALSPSIFRAAARGPSLSQARGAQRPRPVRPIGTRLRWRLSETATVTFRVQRAAKGRRVGGRCVRQTRRNRARRRCTRYVTLRGSFSHTGGAGANSARFSGRLRGRKLRPGRYRLLAEARDPAGNRTRRPATRRFRIVRR